MENVNKKNLGRVTFFALWVLIAACALFTFTHRIVVVSGDSMYPYLQDGDLTISSKATSLIRGDVYLLNEPDDGYPVIKRLVGMPGDVIQFHYNNIFINGELYWSDRSVKFGERTIELMADEYFFLGDNYANSKDGRHWNRLATSSDVLYHLEYIAYPFHRQATLFEKGVIE